MLLLLLGFLVHTEEGVYVVAELPGRGVVRGVVSSRGLMDEGRGVGLRIIGERG